MCAWCFGLLVNVFAYRFFAGESSGLVATGARRDFVMVLDIYGGTDGIICGTLLAGFLC